MRAPSTTKNSGTKKPSPSPMSCSATPAGLAEQRDHQPAAKPASSALVSKRSAIHASVNSTRSESRRSSAQAEVMRRVAQLLDRRRAREMRWMIETEDGRARDDQHRAGERAAEAARRQHERNGEHRRDVGERDPRDRHEQRFVVVVVPMIGSTIAAELDATSTARIAGRCRPGRARPASGADDDREHDRDARSTNRPRRAAPRSRVSRSGSFVATMNINSAKPMSARNASVGCGRDDGARSRCVRRSRPPRSRRSRPAARTLVGSSASIGPSSPIATTSARVP